MSICFAVGRNIYDYDDENSTRGSSVFIVTFALLYSQAEIV